MHNQLLLWYLRGNLTRKKNEGTQKGKKEANNKYINYQIIYSIYKPAFAREKVKKYFFFYQIIILYIDQSIYINFLWIFFFYYLKFD